jgi:hypothetical protein
LAQAFVTDPLFEWSFPDEPSRIEATAARRVIQRGLAAATDAGVGVHLETTNGTTLSFYESLGFAVTNSFTLESGGPAASTLWRDPT